MPFTEFAQEGWCTDVFADFYHQYTDSFIASIQNLDVSVIEQIQGRIEAARRHGRQIFVLGNGGSAASAAHWVCDFAKGASVPNVPRIKMYSLTDNGPWVSALANDIEFADIFVEQLRNFAEPGDLVIGLSVSGNSENIVRAFQFARDRSCACVSLVGDTGGRMAALSDLVLTIPSQNYGIVEDIHMFINHAISQYLKAEYERLVDGAAPVWPLDSGRDVE